MRSKNKYQPSDRSNIPHLSAPKTSVSMIPPAEDHVQLIEQAVNDAHTGIETLEMRIIFLQERNSNLNIEIIETVHQHETYKTEMFAYETSIKQLFDKRELRGALLGLRRVWEIMGQREAVKARLAEREREVAGLGDREGSGEMTQAVKEDEVEKVD
jgi:hypothetical protein